PQPFAEDVFARIERAVSKSVADASTVASAGRLFVSTEDDPGAGGTAAPIPDLPIEYFVSSDRQVVAAHKAQPYEQAQLLRSRQEGELLVSYKTSGGWVAITKDVLTDVLGTGRDAKVVGLPREAAAVLKLMCPHLVTLP